MKKVIKVTAASDDGKVAEIEVSPESNFEDVRLVLAVEFGVEPNRLSVAFQGESIPDHATLDDVGVEEHDMLAVSFKGEEGDPGNNRVSMSRFGFRDIFQQKMIEREIKMQNINDNIEEAFAEAPESFTKVLMLFIEVDIKGQKVKAFVDSGAQTTVMSKDCAERCGLLRLVDTRHQGVVQGVGTSQIYGRIHLAPLKIGHQIYKTSLIIMDQGGLANMDFLLGLDMLKKHQCMIDLKNDCLHIGDDEVVPFLAEKDVPEAHKLS